MSWQRDDRREAISARQGAIEIAEEDRRDSWDQISYVGWHEPMCDSILHPLCCCEAQPDAFAGEGWRATPSFTADAFDVVTDEDLTETLVAALATLDLNDRDSVNAFFNVMAVARDEQLRRNEAKRA